MQRHAPKYGYMRDADGLTVINPTERYILYVVYDLFRLGTSCAKIANQLNLLGYSNRAGMPWNRQGVKQLIDRERFSVLYLPGDAEQEVRDKEEHDKTNWFTEFRYKPLALRK